MAKQGKPEELAANVARLFLGVRLECAQCHDHPFGKWKREQFWSQAAFFAGLKGQRSGDFFYGPLVEVSDRRELTIPNTDRAAQAPEGRLFARMAVKGMTSEQLYDSICVAAGVRDSTPFQQRVYSFGTQRQQFQDRFTDQEKRTEYHTSIPQALTMMNNQMILDATHPDRAEVLGAVVAAPFMKNPARIEALFLAALSRKPTPLEAGKFLSYVEAGGAS